MRRVGGEKGEAQNKKEKRLGWATKARAEERLMRKRRGRLDVTVRARLVLSVALNIASARVYLLPLAGLCMASFIASRGMLPMCAICAAIKMPSRGAMGCGRVVIVVLFHVSIRSACNLVARGRNRINAHPNHNDRSERPAVEGGLGMSTGDLSSSRRSPGKIGQHLHLSLILLLTPRADDRLRRDLSRRGECPGPAGPQVGAKACVGV